MRKRLTHNAHRFFRVVQDVDSYKKFIDFMPESRVHKETKVSKTGQYGKNKNGRFDATTTIGFNAVSFDYVSKVTYSHPVVPVNFKNPKNLSWRVTSLADSSRIFDSMNSEWVIQPCKEDPLSSCIIDYRIEMAFANPLYAGITSRFFDFLVENINGQFEERCKHVSLKGEYSDEIKYEDVEEEVVIKCKEDE